MMLQRFGQVEVAQAVLGIPAQELDARTVTTMLHALARVEPVTGASDAQMIGALRKHLLAAAKSFVVDQVANRGAEMLELTATTRAAIALCSSSSVLQAASAFCTRLPEISIVAVGIDIRRTGKSPQDRTA